VCFGVDDELGSGVEGFDVLRKRQKKTIFRHNQALSVYFLIFFYFLNESLLRILFVFWCGR
jgi:hypothetical protein